MHQPVIRLIGSHYLALLPAIMPTVNASAHSSELYSRPYELVKALGTDGPSAMPLGWITYVGGTGASWGEASATDSQGNLYIIGGTCSADYPVTPGAAQLHYGGRCDAFVAAYNPSGHQRWATYLGGSDDEIGIAIAADAQGSIFVTGLTASPDFPVTPGAPQPHWSGQDDAFVAAYDAASGRLRWATFLGGPGDNWGNGIATDRHGNVYVTGEAGLSFPIISGGVHRVSGGGAFVAAYTARGQLRWTTSLGVAGQDAGIAIASDTRGHVYLAGSVTSHAFPLISGSGRPPSGGSSYGFVAAYTEQGRLRWDTILGGSGNSIANGLATDPKGQVYVTGNTTAANFPVTPGALQDRLTVGQHAFVVACDAGGRLRWATYLGGQARDSGTAVTADQQGIVYVTGYTTSPDFPVTPAAYQTRYVGGSPTNADAFVVAFDGKGRVRAATYLGGSANNLGNGIATDTHGSLYVIGTTSSSDFPVTPGAAQTVFTYSRPTGEDTHAFVARLVLIVNHPPAFDPASPPPPGTPHARFFLQTHHTLRDPFLSFWDSLGGIPTLGLPLSEPFVLAEQQIQVTERAVLLRSSNQIRILPLGRWLSAARTFAPVRPVANSALRLYFSSTGHTLSGLFLAYWQAHQGSILLGAPISEPDWEGLGDGTGRVYLVQWFVNGRLELHPEVHDPRYRVEQGRVGYEYLHRLGLL
jgi:hypothetical protein